MLFRVKKINTCYNQQSSGGNMLSYNIINYRHYHNNAGRKVKWFFSSLILKWIPIGICGGICLEYYLHKRYTGSNLASKLQRQIYCTLPLRISSRTFGWVANCSVPISLRSFVYSTYSSAFGVKLDEAAKSNLEEYRSLSEFFTRSLKEDCRIIDANSCLVSPADGKVLHFGIAECEHIEQVKGVTYSLQKFLGPVNWTTKESVNVIDKMKSNGNGTSLFHCVIYLAPGDYHRFHSPTNWFPLLRRHFHGELLSVNPRIAQWFPDLFSINERVVYTGNWEHGFFCFAAVGATNVGSIEIYKDDILKTNRKWNFKPIKDKCDELLLEQKFSLTKGEEIGRFNMGSTIVLIFEAPDNFKFNLISGQTVKMGESLGSIIDNIVS